MSFGYAINEAGTVAGVSIYISANSHISRAVMAEPGRPVTDLNLTHATSTSINEYGEIIGFRRNLNNNSYYSWYYSPRRGLIPDLRAVVEEPEYFSRVSDARGINDIGQIIASGNNGHVPNDLTRRALLLTPTGAHRRVLAANVN